MRFFTRLFPRGSAFPCHVCVLAPVVPLLARHYSDHHNPSPAAYGPKAPAIQQEHGNHGAQGRVTQGQVSLVDQAGRVFDAYLHEKGETSLSLIVVAAGYCILMPWLMAAAESIEGCEVTVDAHTIGFYRVDIPGREKHNHKNRIHVAITGQCSLHGRSFINDGSGQVSHENVDLGMAELSVVIEFEYGRGWYDFYYMDKHKLHRLDNYDAFNTVSNLTRGFSDEGRSTVQFPIDDRAPNLDGHHVPTAGQGKERLRQVSLKTAQIFQSFGGDFNAMTKMPIDEACKYIITVVES
ncbi:unnamed protein product [Vitrella brassicaformis CCMP3155]|uniref:Uncharacterized protein n=1 Tax=Vitrella brassicaformis (strain CCMP3155) TaxID=1169540 RepID=A0A0G4H0N2_VITBC|nr:unnamed protein product [Vitrella brassicaformis CCMP3155]|eukprot:CEM37131.1 unnamed protein product [Vitrella brassicaformis CCMP3155]